MTDLVEVVGVLNEDLHAHSESELVQVEVNAGNLAVGDFLGHALGAASCLNGVPVDELRLAGRLAVRLQNVHVLHGILGLAGGVLHLHSLHSLHDHVCEEIRLGAQKLGGHRSGRRRFNLLVRQLSGLNDELLLDEVD